jgi:hypothetical protein
MVKVNYIGLLMALFSVSLPLFTLSAESQEAGEIKEIRGIVDNVDWVGSKLVIHYLEYDGGNDTLAFDVPDSAVITRGSDRIALSDIVICDSVTVEYCDRGINGLDAIRIRDHNLYNR